MTAETLTDIQRAALRRVLEDPIFELIPLENALEQAAHLPAGASVSITASPARTLEDTIELAAQLQARGFKPIPHLAARMTRNRTHLEALLGRIGEIGITGAFVIGGDAPFEGEFYDAESLLKAMADLGHPLTEIGIAAYPEGHHVFDEETATAALHAKQPYATSLTTQMCFDAAAIGKWLEQMRSQGITLPVYLGIPGVVERLKLMRIATRIGVGRSARFLAHNRRLLRKFVQPGGYAPDELLEDLAGTLTATEAGIAGVHIYTFNQVETTEAWRRCYLRSL